MATRRITATKTSGYGHLPNRAVAPGYKQQSGTTFSGAKPTPTPAPPASSPAPGTTDLNSLPVDPAYDAQIGGLTKRRDDTLAGLTQQRTAGLSNYGYNATYDEQGNATSLTFDPNNPYSQAALARKHYQQAKTGTTNSMAARGQGFSGAFLNAQNANDTNFAVGEDSRQKALMQFLAGNVSAGAGARSDYETAAGGAYGDRLGRAPKSPLYDPSTGTGTSQTFGNVTGVYQPGKVQPFGQNIGSPATQAKLAAFAAANAKKKR